MNLSSLYKSGILCSVACGVIALWSLIQLLAGDLTWADAVFRAVVAAIVMAAFYYQWRVGEAIKLASGACQKAARGDFEARIVLAHEHGEVGEMFWAVNDLLDRVDGFVREVDASFQYARKRKYFRRILATGMEGGFLACADSINQETIAMGKAMTNFSGMVDGFETLANSGVGRIASASGEVQNAARTFNGSASQALGDIQEIRHDIAQAAGNVHAASATVDRMSSLLASVAARTGEATYLSQDAVTKAEGVSSQARNLVDACARIGDVVALINAIAEQTNLLALNATIEAARAGESGKGFAVVAQEVKALSNQTARATEDIARHMAAIQAGTTEVAGAIQEVSQAIAGMSAISAAIADAVREQEGAAREVVGNTGRTVEATDHVASLVDRIAGNLAGTGEAAEELLRASGDLGTVADSLHQEVGRFLTEARRMT
ncbi:MAG TPA: methyl-accepting chemotaxis protein [Azospirillaceae bacterium]|nr:methyl-accepting chemotaxis protein [Azospirillaceae bacterium]